MLKSTAIKRRLRTGKFGKILWSWYERCAYRCYISSPKSFFMCLSYYRIGNKVSILSGFSHRELKLVLYGLVLNKIENSLISNLHFSPAQFWSISGKKNSWQVQVYNVLTAYSQVPNKRVRWLFWADFINE